MLTYKRKKELNKLKYKIIDIILYPIRCICTPIYNFFERSRKSKRYSHQKIKQLIQYCIDYHLNYDECIYIVATDFAGEDVKDCGGCGYWNLCDIGYSHNRIRKKITHIYHYQKDEYVAALKELCGTPLTLEEKKNEFSYEMNGRQYHRQAYYRLQDREVYKIGQDYKSKL